DLAMVGGSDQTGDDPARFIVSSAFHALPFFDSVTRLTQVRARWLDHTTGTFLTPDPMGYKDSANSYAYCAGDPVNGRDPTGNGVFVVYREFTDGPQRKLFPATGHYFIAFDEEGLDDVDNWRAVIKEARQRHERALTAGGNVETFSFHPDPKSKYNVATIFTSGSRIGYDDIIDKTTFEAARSRRGRAGGLKEPRIWKLQTTREQQELLYRRVVAERNRIETGDNAFGSYALLLNDCGTWARHVIEELGNMTWPEDASQFNGGGVGVGGASELAFGPELLMGSAAAPVVDYEVRGMRRGIVKVNNALEALGTASDRLRRQMREALDSFARAAERDVKAAVGAPE
ncbi:MAG TPA: RHS repeat-associated core domain-containing protein, partial [Thermoanaerobaculia bacterium]